MECFLWDVPSCLESPLDCKIKPVNTKGNQPWISFGVKLEQYICSSVILACSFLFMWHVRQQKRHRYIEQSFGLCGRGRECDDLGEWHWNMYNVIYETNRQSRFNAWYWIFGAGALGRPRGMVRGGRRERGSGFGTRVYLWRIHVDVWQNQYNIVK